MNWDLKRMMDSAARIDSEIERKSNDGVMLLNGADLQIEPIDWLWIDWLARGKLHLLAGEPGQGKTTLALAFAATVSSGGRWPDGTRAAAGNVVIYSGEDDPNDTLGPRLIAAGADLSRCHFVTGTREDGTPRPFDPAVDIAELARTITQVGGVDLLIVDPIVGAVTGDSHKNTETRRALQPLVELAAECSCSLLGITHFAKGGQGVDPAQRVIGSVAFTALARIVLVAAKTQSNDGDSLRILARAKSNIGPAEGGFEYYLAQTPVQNDMYAARVSWGDAVEGSARALLAGTDDVGSDTNDLVDLLRAELSGGGWYPAKNVIKTLKDAGYTAKQIRTTRVRLGVVLHKGSFEDGWY